MKRILFLTTALLLSVLCLPSFAYYLEYNVDDNLIWSGFSLDYYPEYNYYDFVDIGNQDGAVYWEAAVLPADGETYDAFATIEVTFIPEVCLTSEYEGFKSFDYYLRGDLPESPIIETFTVPVGETLYEGFPNVYVPVPYITDYPEPIPDASHAYAYLEMSVNWDAVVRLTGVHLNAAPVPEPSTILLLSVGFLGIFGKRKFGQCVARRYFA